MTDLDIRANRSAQKWSRKAQLGRVFWAFAHPFFRWSPRFAWGWRRWLLRRFGARIGTQVHIYPTAKITIPWNLGIGDESAIGDCAILYALGPITIGSQVTISQYVHLCAGSHDYRRGDMLLLKPPIAVGDGSWICADAFVGPGVTIGSNVVVGARSVVVRDVPSEAIVAGNPARKIGERT